jgi:acetyl esterase/lipase
LQTIPYNDSSLKLAYGSDDLQYGRLYLPETANLHTPAPLVVFIHGGCWLNTYDINHSRAFSQTLAKHGYAVWSVEYRRTGDIGGAWPGSFDDILAGLNYAQRSLSRYPIDVTKLVIAGHSAGGQLALLAASHSVYQFDTKLNAVHAVIGLAAITDMVAYANGDNSCQRATSKFLGGDHAEHADVYQQANPQQQPIHPVTILLQGTTDIIVPPEQASSSGMPFKLVENVGHFDWIHPQSNAYKVFLTTLQELLTSELP